MSKLSRFHRAKSGALVVAAAALSVVSFVPISMAQVVSIGPGSSPAGGYLPLSAFGISTFTSTDDSLTNFTVPAFTFAGQSWTSIGFASNGYLVIGGGTGPKSSIDNQNFPDASAPNNILAPYWTDLNPTAGGGLRIGTLTDGSDTWIVCDWNAVPEFGSAANTHTFEVWIGVQGDAHPGEDVTFAYGAMTGNGNGGLVTVGAEDASGQFGSTYYYNGTGTLPVNGTQLRVTTSGLPVVPEPSTWAMIAGGLLALVGVQRTRRTATA